MTCAVALAVLLAALVNAAASAQARAGGAIPPPPPPQGARLDLTGPFHTRSPWRLVVTEGPPAKDYGGNDAPGALTLCLHKGRAGPCLSAPVTPPPPPWLSVVDVDAWEPHYLHTAEIVYPRGRRAAPLLLIATGSLYSGDGDQLEATQLVRYDARRDAFRRILARSTGRNNNQEIRFIAHGPLRGDVVDAEPEEHPPFGYWITVDRLTPANVYQRVLRYRGATRYNDGNPLAVIDSEMPTILRRLNLWKPGDSLPAPRLVDGKPCREPKLKKAELWCW